MVDDNTDNLITRHRGTRRGVITAETFGHRRQQQNHDACEEQDLVSRFASKRSSPGDGLISIRSHLITSARRWMSTDA